MVVRDDLQARAGALVDSPILEEIWAALWSEKTLRVLDLDSLAVEVAAGEVRLRGHVSKDLHKLRLGDLVAGVPGVVSVHNEVISDRELSVQVALALASDERTRPYRISVVVFHGWVRLHGELPTLEALAAVEGVAARPAKVRGIIALPRLAGESSAERRRMLQPLADDLVYAQDSIAGRVASVVINPRSRLVTHLVLAADFEEDGRRTKEDIVVPAGAIERVAEGSVFLSVRRSALAAFGTFNEEAFPPGPADWQAPFPYERATVRWPEGSAL